MCVRSARMTSQIYNFSVRTSSRPACCANRLTQNHSRLGPPGHGGLGVMTRHYTAMHWGVYEIEPRPGQPPALHGVAGDPDPSPIGLDMLDASVSRLRVRRPAIRRGWLERGPGPSDARGRDEFVEVNWDTALGHVAAEIIRVRQDFGK